MQPAQLPHNLGFTRWGDVRDLRGADIIFRRTHNFGVATIHLGGGLLLVFDRRGVWEWNGLVLRRWVEVIRVGLQMDGPVQWYYY